MRRELTFGEKTAVLIRARGLRLVKKYVVAGGRVLGEYIYIRVRGMEIEAEYDVEDRALYYLSICGRSCVVWTDGEPDKAPGRNAVRRAYVILREAAKFSSAARAALRIIRRYRHSRSTHRS
ncbi:MAG: hypothetical protein TU35_008505 [Thermoproteus sp. AZ2]|jgi:hypothetical protein|uniref:Uncharacterized protein n=1 Tax=Thermoproteus sp. AZ2 TaxID=1609232 RepID=A0ACC6V2U9_9CREN|nr:MAG: hypothetical protein TU35_07840 [Thermoproteus sp. AZ2]